MEVRVYEPPDFAELSGAQCTGARRTAHAPIARWSHGIPLLGALASILLHTLLITAFAWGGMHARAPTPQPSDFGTSRRVDNENSEFAMQVVSLEDPPSTELSSLGPDIGPSPALAPVKLDSALVAGSLPSLAEDDDAAIDSSADTEKTAAAIFGRYIGQIDARIERAWRRPRDSVKERVFSCRVRIEQDAAGFVREITLERCNGSSRWQLSLVHAIQLASPLPAPPDPKVFKRLLRLDFQAQPYSAGAPEDLYEQPSS